MALITGTPLGTINSSESIYPTLAPYIYFQDYTAALFNNPDPEGYYWRLSGTATYPVYAFECVSDVSFTEGRTLNDVQCDNIGIVSTVEVRDYVEFQVTIKSIFPFSSLAKILSLTDATVSAGNNTEKVGIGKINNNQFWHVYAPHVYDESAADWMAFSLHKAKFVDAWTINMPYSEAWNVTGLKLRGYADTTKPSAQQFGMLIRTDASAL